MVGKGHYRPMYSDHGFDHMRLAEHLGQYDDAPIDDYVRWLVHNGRADHRATHMFGPDDTVEAKEFAASSGARAFQHEERYHSTSWVRDESLTFLRERDSSKPFLLVVSFPRPHAPFDPPPRWIERIDSEQFPVDSLSDSHADALPPLAQSLIRGDKGYKPVRVADLDPERVRDVLVYRAALIAQIDDAVGRLIDQVDLDDTTICFTSDHGDYAGRHGLLMKTPFLPFDDLARVPFVWAGAGVAGGRVASSPVQNFDLATTMLELAGLPVLGVDGESLAAELSGAEQDPDRVVMTDSLYQYRMVRRGSLKFFRHELTREEMAFDVIDDPSETTNVVADDRYRSRVDELREELDRIMAVGIVELDVV
jgi:arylsulfatase A-like enzyme